MDLSFRWGYSYWKTFFDFELGLSTEGFAFRLIVFGLFFGIWLLRPQEEPY